MNIRNSENILYICYINKRIFSWPIKKKPWKSPGGVTWKVNGHCQGPVEQGIFHVEALLQLCCTGSCSSTEETILACSHVPVLPMWKMPFSTQLLSRLYYISPQIFNVKQVWEKPGKSWKQHKCSTMLCVRGEKTLPNSIEPWVNSPVCKWSDWLNFMAKWDVWTQLFSVLVQCFSHYIECFQSVYNVCNLLDATCSCSSSPEAWCAN